MEKLLNTWTFRHAVLMTVIGSLAVLLDNPWILPVAMCISIAILLTEQRQTWLALKPFGGYANHVTLIRFILFLVILGFHSILHPYVFVGLVLSVIIADGIDGYLARRFDTSSDFGEIFDTEIDAFLAIALSVLIWSTFPSALWVLAGGFLRYLFVILYRVLGWDQMQRPHMPETKLFAVLYFISLLTPWLLPWDVAVWIVLAGNALVSFSFIREFVLIMRVR
jgi:phosphatidylglycerophosphate synthase